MQFPQTTKKQLIYVTTTVVLLGGGIFYLHKHGASPAAVKPASPALSADAKSDGPKGDLAKIPAGPAPAASAATGGPTKMAAQPRAKVQTYKVAEGDSVGTIAEKFGLKPTSVLWANDLDENDVIQIGQELKIPAVDGVVYTVASGDTLWDIAGDHGSTVEDVVKANPDINPDALQEGQVVLIPGGQPAARAMLASRGTGRTAVQSFGYWPASGPITDPFGWRIHPVYGTKNFHDGVDIGVPVGTTLVAVASGKVTMATYFGGYGYSIRVDHGGGVVTQYSHMSQMDVRVGQSVSAGQRIGLSGNTGVSTGPHCHFMVIVNGSPTDPMPWLP